jgi:hypothetical protein
LATSDNASQYDVGVSLLPALLAQRESFDRRLRYKRAREMMLPQILESTISIQLKAVDSALGSSSPVELVPLIVMRIDFDEPVLGSESITVSMGVDVMESMRLDIAALREQYQHLVKLLPNELLKSEAYLVWPQEQEQELER